MLKRMPPPSKRTNDPERTKRDILEVAMAEFASEGYSGARVDAIAARTRTSKRMIYYYFGGKEQLYLAVLEEAYRSIRALEDQLDIESCDAREGLRLAVQECWNIGSLSTEAQRVTVTISVQMSQSGVPETNSVRMIDNTGGSETAIRQAFEAARRAVLRCGTSGYDLPVESYDHWREIEITFNPEEMRLR